MLRGNLPDPLQIHASLGKRQGPKEHAVERKFLPDKWKLRTRNELPSFRLGRTTQGVPAKKAPSREPGLVRDVETTQAQHLRRNLGGEATGGHRTIMGWEGYSIWKSSEEGTKEKRQGTDNPLRNGVASYLRGNRSFCRALSPEALKEESTGER